MYDDLPIDDDPRVRQSIDALDNFCDDDNMGYVVIVYKKRGDLFDFVYTDKTETEELKQTLVREYINSDSELKVLSQDRFIFVN